MRHAPSVAVLSALLVLLPTARAEEEAPGDKPLQAPSERLDAEAPDAEDAHPDALLEVVADLKGHHGRLVRALAFSPDGKVLATSGSDRSIRLWHVGAATAKAVATVPPSD